MPFHVVGPRDRLGVVCFPPWWFLSCSSSNSWFEHFYVDRQCLRSVYIHVECTPNVRGKKKDVGSSRSTFFINFFHMGAIFWFSPAILISSMKTDKNNPCIRWTNKHSQFGNLVPSKIHWTIVFPTRGLRVGVRTKFVQEEPLGLRCWTKILATCVVEEVPIYVDILTLEFWAIWEHLPSLPECMLIRRRLLVHHSLVW